MTPWREKNGIGIVTSRSRGLCALAAAEHGYRENNTSLSKIFFFLPFSDRKKEFLFRLLYSEQKPYPRRSGIRNVKVYAYHANSYSRKIFEFLGVKNKEKGRSHSSQFKPQQFPGDGGWWSGWQRQRVYCSNHIVSIDSIAVVFLPPVCPCPAS